MGEILLPGGERFRRDRFRSATKGVEFVTFYTASLIAADHKRETAGRSAYHFHGFKPRRGM
jgi:hypothetical protein